MSMEHSESSLVTAELEHALSLLEIELAAADGREIIIGTDFDQTLCDEYVFDTATNNHVANIDPTLAAAARSQHMIINTSRRAENPTVRRFWSSGLIPPDRPVIVEGGGVILSPNVAGGLDSIATVEQEDLAHLHAVPGQVRESIGDIPDGQDLIFKIGRTMMVTRLQDKGGNALPHHQQWLAEQVREVISSPSLQVVDTRASVTVQHRDVNKGVGLRKYFELMGIAREDVYVIGMGDGRNDKELFEEADLSLGFSDIVSPLVDIDVPHGPRAAPHILRMIGGKLIDAVE
jgi:predicted mannosyl-3-phosphoglycerate phosphatase (HAD superfamily)